MKKLATLLTLGLTIAAVFVGAVMSSPVLANTEQDGGIITANGKASITATPDVAWVNVGVISEKPTVEAAQAEVNRNVDKILATLKQLGVKDANIKTINFSINPVYVWNEPAKENRLSGYSVNHQLEVKIDAIQTSGKLLDQVVKAGGNYVSGIRFGLNDESAIYAKALENAVLNAKVKAEAMGRGISVKGLKPISIKEQPSYSTPFFNQPMAAKAMDAAPETTVMSGELVIQAEVIVEFKY